jgi:hypothetical protein
MGGKHLAIGMNGRRPLRRGRPTWECRASAVGLMCYFLNLNFLQT